MKERIIEIIRELVEAYESSFDISPVANTNTIDLIFCEAVSCYRGEMAGKSRNIDSTSPKTQSGGSDKPTAKQIAFLTKMKVTIPPTKKAASEMISNYIANQQKENI